MTKVEADTKTRSCIVGYLLFVLNIVLFSFDMTTYRFGWHSTRKGSNTICCVQ